jgi:hypothetical protein
MQVMNSRRILIMLSLMVLSVVVDLRPAQGQTKAKAFDQAMSLDETMAWLGKQLTLQRSFAPSIGSSAWTRSTRLIKAKGCTLSFWSTIETDGLEPASPGYVSRELWTLNLAGLDPARIRGLGVGQVWFWAEGNVYNAIRTNIFNRDLRLLGVRGNRAMGHFWVRDERDAIEVSTGLRHAVDLCRQGKP